MIETVRICRKKWVAGFGIILLAGMLFSLYFQGVPVLDEKEYRTQQKEYVLEYPGYIQGIVQSADNLQQIRIFSQQDSFSEKNIEKTREDYQNLEALSLVTFDGRFLTAFFSYLPIRFVTLVFTLLIAFLLSEKQSEGLEGLLFSCRKGRLQLCIRKFGALAFLTVGFTGICYAALLGTCYLKMSPEEGLNVFFYPIQSVSLFRDYIYVHSVWQVLLLYVGIQCILNIFCGFLLFALRMWNQIPIWGNAAFLFILIVEYALYRGISETSFIAILKYSNLFYLLEQGFGFFEYKNFWFGNALVNKQNVIGFVLEFGISSIFLLTNVLMFSRYPGNVKKRMSGCFKVWKAKKDRIYGKWLERKSLLGIEIDKVLLFQKGWLLLLILCFWGYRTLDYTSISFSVVEQKVMDFVDRNCGTITSESEAELKEMAQTIEKVEEEYQQAISKYEKKQLSDDAYLAASVKYQSYADTMETYKILSEKTEYLKQLKRKREIDGWYIEEGAFAYLFGFEKSGNINAIIFSFGLLLLCSGIFRFERKSGMLPVIVATTDGREKLVKVKRNTIALLTLLVCSVLFFFEMFNVAKLYGMEGLQAPVQSFRQLEQFPICCTMGLFLVGYYLFRYLVLFLCTYVVARIGGTGIFRFAVKLGNGSES